MPVASKAVPSVIASSVCWSLQCLVSALTQRGWWRTLFFFFRLTCSVVLRGGRKGCCKQITLACACSASATLGLPPVHGTCSLSAHTAQALGCSAGNHLWPALGCLYFPGPSRSGSGTRVVLRGANSRACILCPSQIRAAQVMRCLARAIVATYRLPAARLSRCALAHLLRQMLTVQTPKKF